MINQMLPGMSKSEELEFIQCGREQCRPGHGYGPAVRDHYLVHYVFKGKGRFYMGGKEYEIAQGGGFFIPPLTLTYYQADSETPWEYAWFGVNGSRAKGLYESVGVCEASRFFSVLRPQPILPTLPAAKTLTPRFLRFMAFSPAFLVCQMPFRPL